MATLVNPYLDAARKYQCRCEWKIGCLGLGCSMCLTTGSDEWRARVEVVHKLQQQYAWAIPDDTAICAIAGRGPVVEIGAGTGYWAWLLAQAGCDVVAYDEKPAFNGWCDHEPYHNVNIGGPDVAALYPDRTLLLCWPPMTDMADRALAAYAGSALVYVGEPDGCTADEAFRERLARYWTEVADLDIPQWCYLHDALWIYERKAVGR